MSAPTVSVCPDVIYEPGNPIAINPTLLAESGRILLERVQGVYAEAGVELPARQIWMAGESAYDCEQLAVSLISLRAGATPNAVSAPPSPCVVFVNAIFTVAVVRCIPVPNDRGTPPTPAALATAADLTATDAYLLMTASCRFDLWQATIQGTPWNYSPPGGMGVEQGVVVETAAGGMQATVLTLTTVIG